MLEFFGGNGVESDAGFGVSDGRRKRGGGLTHPSAREGGRCALPGLQCRWSCAEERPW